MKIAVCGSGPLALETSIFLNEMGASVRLFCRGELGGNIKRLYTKTPKLKLGNSFEDLVSDWGMRTLNHPKLDHSPSVENYWENYLGPLIETSQVQKLCREGEVLRVQKRFLGLEEEIFNKKRILDLFRVVYKHDPKDGLSKQAEENKEVFDKLDPKFMESLAHSLEKFEDFDLVVDARGSFYNPMPAGPSSTWAINEKDLGGDERIFYGVNDFLNLKDKIKNKKNIVLLGSGETAAFGIYLLEEWIESSSENEILLITPEVKSFSRFLETSENEFLKDFIKDRLNRFDKTYILRNEEYEIELKKWEELELYMKAKIPKPNPPKKMFSSLNGWNLTSVDSLIDNNNLFVTMESAPFRGEEDKHRTLGTEALLVANGYKLDQIFSEGLKTEFHFSGKKTASEMGVHSEPGFYTLNCKSLQEGIKNISFIVEDMLSFFSKKE